MQDKCIKLFHCKKSSSKNWTLETRDHDVFKLVNLLSDKIEIFNKRIEHFMLKAYSFHIRLKWRCLKRGFIFPKPEIILIWWFVSWTTYVTVTTYDSDTTWYKCCSHYVKTFNKIKCKSEINELKCSFEISNYEDQMNVLQWEERLWLLCAHLVFDALNVGKW